MPKTTIHLLFIDDSNEAVLPLVRVLVDAGYTPSWERVDTAETLHRALEKHEWDLAIAGYDRARLRSIEALRLTHAQTPTLPFIVVGDRIGEEAVVALIKAGADDFVLRENLLRLPSSVQAALQDVSDYKKMQEHTHYQVKLLEHVSDAIISTDLAFNIVSWNAIAEKMYGWKADEVIGKEFRALVNPEYHTDSRETVLNTFLTTGKYQGKAFHHTKEGRLIVISASVAMIKDAQGTPVGAVSINRDITEQHQTEKTLRQSERRLATLMSNLPGMAYRCLNDPTRTMQFVSDGCVPLTGHHPSALLHNRDKAFADLIQAEDQAYVHKEVQAALQDERPFELEYRITAADGAEKYVWERGVGVYDSGELSFIEGFITDISKRKQAEDQIRLQATVMEAAANSIVITHRDGTITWVNPAFTRLTGYTAEETLGKNPRILKSNRQDPSYYKTLWETVLSGSVWQGELINRCKDGRLYTGELTITPVFDKKDEIRYFVGIMRDVTERKQAEEALRRSEERNRAMIEAIPDLLFRMDASGIVLDFHATPDQLIVPLEALPGLSLDESPLPPDVVANTIASVQEALQTRRMVELEYALSMVDEIRSFEARFIKSGDQEVIAIVRDITERKQAAKEREQLIDELEQRNAELERFAYTVSHDLKTPLVTIKGFLGILEKDAARADHQRLSQNIHVIGKAADQMAHLLNDLLELSRIGRQTNPPEVVALTDLARNAATMTSSQIMQRGVTVVIAEAMPVVLGDRVRLLEVYQNLLENAIKFMGNQPAPRVDIGARLEGSEVLSWVRDNGVGISPKYHEIIFGLFERLDTKIDGTGLGLTLIKRIVEVHGGRIWVESDGEAQGSTFWFTLPAAAQDA